MLLLKEKYGSNPFEWRSEKAGVEIELIKISVDISDSHNFQRLNDHEIVFKNKLYDVVKSFVKGNTHYFYCINDLAEEKYLDQIRQCNEANLDYFNSKYNSVPTFVKFFTLKNWVKEALGKNLPVLNFIYSIASCPGEMEIFLNRVHPPPEQLFKNFLLI